MIKLKDFFSFKQNRFFWLNIIGMVVVILAAIGGTLFWLDAYTHHGQSYLVPNVKHKSLEQAQLLLHNQNMQGVVVDSTYVKELSPGIILEQKPEGGMRVKEGRTIYLTINTREVPRVRIPDIIDNSSVRQAAAKLKAMKFKLTEPELVPGEQDWVYGIKYRGKSLKSGDKVPFEAVLTLCIGNTHLRDSLATDTLGLNLGQESEAQVDDSWF